MIVSWFPVNRGATTYQLDPLAISRVWFISLTGVLQPAGNEGKTCAWEDSVETSYWSDSIATLSVEECCLMSNLNAELNNVVVGDDYDVVRTLTNVPAGTLIETGWLTIKLQQFDADPGLIQKEITGVSVSGVGHINDDGSGDQVAGLIFQLTSADTLLLNYHKKYWYDIQVRTASGKIKTIEKGRLQPVGEITLDT